MSQRIYTPEELESVRLTELMEASKGTPAQRASSTYMQPDEGQVKLYHPDYAALKYGPGSGPVTNDQIIVFGNEEEHVAIVRADHPLLAGLLRTEPAIVVLRPGEKAGRTYACESCDQEFPSKALLSQHKREAHAKRQQKAPSSDEG